MKKRHHWIVRVTHWVNVVAIIIMVGSGLQIFNAYPAFARKGELFCCYPFEHKPIPDWHFIAMVAIVTLSVIHVFMIFAVDPYSLPSMITGNYNPLNSPEKRNAR